MKTTVEQVIELIDEQKKVLIERAKQHGSFDVFDRAGKHAGISALEVATTMCAVKKARLETNPDNWDSLVDLLNYQAIATVMSVNIAREEKQ
jgi:hypothetical protein